MSGNLRKSLSLPMMVALGAAGVIGTSWVFTASEFFKKYGAGGEILGLALGAILAVCVALAYAELASRFPRAGGELVFAYAAFGRGPAFIAGWLLIGAYVSSLAFYVTASGMLLAEIFPSLQQMTLYSIAGTEVYLPVLILGIALCCAIWLLTYTGMGLAGGFQLVLLIAMVLIGIALAIVGFSHGRFDNFWPPYAPDAEPFADTLRFVLPAMTFLTGFSLITTLAEDAKLSPRHIGYAVVATVVVAAGFYCTVLLATAWLIPWETTATLDDGVIDAYRKAGFPLLAWGAFSISVLGLVTSFLALFPAASRVILAMGRAGLFPSVFSQLSRSGRPVNALLFTLLLTLGLGWLGRGALLWFLDTGGIYIGLAWCIAVFSFYRIRRDEPASRAPFHAGPAWLPGIGAVAALCVIVVILLLGTSLSLAWPYEYLILAVWFVLGAMIYAIVPRVSVEETRAAVLGTAEASQEN
ncbi:MAG: APC family permease [Hyphomicrobiales bacterium]|nr:APC family permease [Hyphomicrobiales bacterium]MCP4997543.1 APC family permease [Hyphomicrobiales bacterium]